MNSYTPEKAYGLQNLCVIYWKWVSQATTDILRILLSLTRIRFFRPIIDKSVFNDNYGVPRMQMALALKGQKVGIRKLRRIMLKMGLIHEQKRRA